MDFIFSIFSIIVNLAVVYGFIKSISELKKRTNKNKDNASKVPSDYNIKKKVKLPNINFNEEFKQQVMDFDKAFKNKAQEAQENRRNHMEELSQKSDEEFFEDIKIKARRKLEEKKNKENVSMPNIQNDYSNNMSSQVYSSTVNVPINNYKKQSMGKKNNILGENIDLRQAIVLSEILGEPKSKKMRRRVANRIN